jgi:ribosome biogenesis protein MAK21
MFGIIDKTEKADYDPYHRNPQYCHAENECIWELENFTVHFHPTVALFAKQILKVQFRLHKHYVACS